MFSGGAILTGLETSCSLQDSPPSPSSFSGDRTVTAQSRLSMVSSGSAARLWSPPCSCVHSPMRWPGSLVLASFPGRSRKTLGSIRHPYKPKIPTLETRGEGTGDVGTAVRRGPSGPRSPWREVQLRF